MSQPASPDRRWALGAREWPAPVPRAPAPAEYRSRARRWISAGCLTLAVLLTPVVQLTAWAEGTLLSTSGFVAALGPLPSNPAVQDQITAQIDRQLQRAGAANGTLASRLADLAESQVARAVPALLGSPAFLRPWRTALGAAHSQLLLVLRDRSHILAINGSALTVNVPMAARTLINATGLPPQLGRLLPPAMPVSVTILDNAALGRASTIVRLTDILGRILLPADVALALAGIATARDRRRALLAIVIPVAALGALGALGIRLLTRTAGSPLVTAATGDLTAPLTRQLLLTGEICAALVALLLTVPGLRVEWRRRRVRQRGLCGLFRYQTDEDSGEAGAAMWPRKTGGLSPPKSQGRLPAIESDSLDANEDPNVGQGCSL